MIPLASVETHKSAAFVILNYKNELLAVSRKNDHSDFGLPGGKLDEGETFFEAALRELFEETGLKKTEGLWINPEPFFEDFHVDNTNQERLYYCKVYVAHISCFDKVKEPEEGGGVIQWMKPLDFLASNKSFGDFAAKYLAKLTFSDKMLFF